MVGLFDTNVVTEVFGTGTASDVVYDIVGLAGLAMLPRLSRTPPRARPRDARPGRLTTAPAGRRVHARPGPRRRRSDAGSAAMPAGSRR